MFNDTWENVIVLDRLEKAASDLKAYMIEETVKRLIKVTKSEEFAGDEPDFDTAIYVDGPDGDHSLIAVEDELAEIIRGRPAMIDVMRDSIEWDTQIFNDDAVRAARAVVNESFELFKKTWAEDQAPQATI